MIGFLYARPAPAFLGEVSPARLISVSTPSRIKRPPAMLTMLGSPRRCCDGLTRRETLTAGALTFLGGAFNLTSLLAAEADISPLVRAGKAKNVILLYLLG